MPGNRPNILLLMSDEHNPAVAGCYGNPIVQTPHLDGLAQRGVVFENAYCNSPLCGPSRISFTAGQYASRVSAWGNGAFLPGDDHPSIARVLKSAGYDALLCGKQHYVLGHRYGFTEIGGDFNQYGASRSVHRREPNDPSINAHEAQRRFAEFHCGEQSEVLDHDRAVTKGAVDFLAGRRRDEAPFFLFVGHLAPHFPLVVPEQYWLPYRDRIADPICPAGHLESQVVNYQQLRRAFGVVDADPQMIRRGRELYYGLTTWLDEQIGMILHTLAKSDVADNTIVIYASDHGENMGEHGLWWKSSMYDCSTRVPLIVSWPKRWTGGQRRTGVCSLVDLVQTIAHCADASAPDDWDGDSLCGVLDDPAAAWRDFAISEYYAHYVTSGITMLRDGRWKYVYHCSHPDLPAQRELYDMIADPGEFTNLAHDPAHAARINAMHAHMLRETGSDPEAIEARCPRHYGPIPAHNRSGWLPKPQLIRT